MPCLSNFFQVTDIYTNALHAAGVRVHLEGADGGNEDVVTSGGLFRLLLSRPTAGLHVLRGLQDWMQRRELSGLWVTSETGLQPWVALEELGKTSTPAGKAALAPAAVKAEESPPHAPPARLNFKSDDEAGVQADSAPPSYPLLFLFELEHHHELRLQEVHPNPPKPPKKKKAATTRKGQTTREGGGMAKKGVVVKKEKRVEVKGAGEGQPKGGEGKRRGHPKARQCGCRTRSEGGGGGREKWVRFGPGEAPYKVAAHLCFATEAAATTVAKGHRAGGGGGQHNKPPTHRQTRRLATPRPPNRQRPPWSPPPGPCP